MARSAYPEHKVQLEQMAETWEQLANARKRQLDKRGVAHDMDVWPAPGLDDTQLSESCLSFEFHRT
jgi:hypothetical protein